jgi:hypothetical protein
MWTWTRHGHILLLDRRGQGITLSSEGAAEELAKVLAKVSGRNVKKTSYRRCEFAAIRLLAQRRRPASPLSAGNNVAPIMILYSDVTVGATSLVALRLFFHNSPVNWAVLTGNGNKVKTG